MRRVADRVTDRLGVHRQAARRQRHDVVRRQTRAVGDGPSDGVAANVRRHRVANAGICDRQVLPVDSGCNRRPQRRRQVHCAAVVVSRVADRVTDGLRVHRQIPGS